MSFVSLVVVGFQCSAASKNDMSCQHIKQTDLCVISSQSTQLNHDPPLHERKERRFRPPTTAAFQQHETQNVHLSVSVYLGVATKHIAANIQNSSKKSSSAKMFSSTDTSQTVVILILRSVGWVACKYRRIRHGGINLFYECDFLTVVV